MLRNFPLQVKLVLAEQLKNADNYLAVEVLSFISFMIPAPQMQYLYGTK